MYLPLFAADLILSLVLVLATVLTAWTIGRGPRLRTARQRRRNARWSLGVLGGGALLVLARVATSALFLAYGPAFAATRLLVALPPLLLAALATAILTVPPLWATATTTAGGDGAEVATAHPARLVPARALAVAALIGVYVVLVPPPVLVAAALLAAWALVVALLWWW